MHVSIDAIMHLKFDLLFPRKCAGPTAQAPADEDPTSKRPWPEEWKNEMIHLRGINYNKLYEPPAFPKRSAHRPCVARTPGRHTVYLI